MYRATTPTHIFTLPFNTDAIDKMLLIYSQNGKQIISKTESDVLFDDNRVIVSLTQEETKRFAHYSAEVQMRIRDTDRIVKASNIITINVFNVLNDEEL